MYKWYIYIYMYVPVAPLEVSRPFFGLRPPTYGWASPQKKKKRTFRTFRTFGLSGLSDFRTFQVGFAAFQWAPPKKCTWWDSNPDSRAKIPHFRRTSDPALPRVLVGSLRSPAQKLALVLTTSQKKSLRVTPKID